MEKEIKIRDSGIWAIFWILAFMTFTLALLGIELRESKEISGRRLWIETKMMISHFCDGKAGTYYWDTNEFNCEK